MSHLPLPLAVVYAGLAGTLLALVVAAATNGWSAKVFFLLALRLAIGWHFLFEGLYKVNTHLTGPTETNKPFSSEPYFKGSPGPIGEQMRNGFFNPGAEIAAKVKAPKNIAPDDFRALSAEQQASECPKEVADQLDKLEKDVQEAEKTKAAKELADADAAAAKAKKSADDAESRFALVPFAAAPAKAAADKLRAKAKTDADEARDAANKKIASFEAAGTKLVTAAKATYARWVYGADPRAATVKGISGEVFLTAPQRLEHLAWTRQQYKDAEARRSNDLGTGTGTDVKRVAEFRTNASAAEADLARDANAFVDELKKDLGYQVPKDAKPELSRGQQMDLFTMWFLVAVGACIMGGLFTRLACVMAAGFLVMTYLAQPPFPWFPPPPPSEGNPVFINKNLIEALALVALASFPTGRWLGLDALVMMPFVRHKRSEI